MTDRLIQIPTQPGMGRSLIEHDDRSKAFRAVDLLGVDRTKPRTKTWRRGGPYDQGQTSECVANTGKGMLNTTPMSHEVPYRIRSHYSTHEFYQGAQLNDEWPGENYDGTSALGLCKYFLSKNLIKEYRWCFGLQDVLLTLSHIGPVGIGIQWKSTMWSTKPDGYLDTSGTTVGGHEVELIGLDTSEKCVIGMNSWGHHWGINGRFKLSYSSLEALLADSGDAFTILR